MQNHLLQVFLWLAMEPPASLDRDNIMKATIGLATSDRGPNAECSGRGGMRMDVQGLRLGFGVRVVVGMSGRGGVRGGWARGHVCVLSTASYHHRPLGGV